MYQSQGISDRDCVEQLLRSRCIQVRLQTGMVLYWHGQMSPEQLPIDLSIGPLHWLVTIKDCAAVSGVVDCTAGLGNLMRIRRSFFLCGQSVHAVNQIILVKLNQRWNCIAGSEEPDSEQTGLFSLPFMKRALEKRKTEAQQEAQAVRAPARLMDRTTPPVMPSLSIKCMCGESCASQTLT